jgi:hypothetical protein
MSRSSHSAPAPRARRSPDRGDDRRPTTPRPRALDIGKERDPEIWEPPVSPIPEVTPAPEPVEVPAPVPARA